MYSRIFGFHLLVWCPKWTPASRSSFIVTAVKSSLLSLPRPLALRVLEAGARAALSVLLSFLDARVAGQESGFLQAGAQGRLELHQRPGDPVSHGARLPGLAAACDVDQDVELVVRLGQDHGLAHHALQRVGVEVRVHRPAVDLHGARTGPQIHARRRRLPPARRVVLHHRHAAVLRGGLKPGPGSAPASGPGADGWVRRTPSASSRADARGSPSGASPSPTIRRPASASPSTSVPPRPA